MGKGKGCSFEESGSQSTHQVCDFSGIPTSDLFLPVHWDICVQRTSYVVQLRFSAIPSFSAPSSFWVIAHIWRNLCVHLIRQFIGCMCMLSGFSRVRLFVTLWTVAHQAPLSMGIFQARILEWVAMLSSRGAYQ